MKELRGRAQHQKKKKLRVCKTFRSRKTAKDTEEEEPERKAKEKTSDQHIREGEKVAAILGGSESEIAQGDCNIWKAKRLTQTPRKPKGKFIRRRP